MNMTPEAFIITLAIIIAITIVLVFNSIFSKPERDYAARDRDRGLAKLYEARAEVLHTESLERQRTESLERQRVMNEKIALRREQICADVRDDAEGSS